MDVEEALAILDKALRPGGLTNIQELVFRQAWQGQTYLETAHHFGYDADYVKDVGSRLWQLLSEAFREKVTKSNFQSVLRRRCLEANPKQLPGFMEEPHPLQAPNELPEVAKLTAGDQTIQLNSLSTMPQLKTIEHVTLNSRQDWGEALDTSFFYGRTVELATLEEWVDSDRCRLIALFGMGGMGKTALAVKLAEKVQGKFDYLVWRSLRNAPAVVEVLTDLVRFLSSQGVPEAETLDSTISRLVECLRRHRCLLVLDNFETILCGGNINAPQSHRAGHYREGYEGYGQLLRRISEALHQSCLILTSREKPIGLASKEGRTLPVRSLQITGLDSAAGQKVLQATGLNPPIERGQALIDCYAGNPLALRIVSRTIQDLFNDDITHFLEQGTLVFGDIRDLLAQQFNRLSQLEKQVIYWLVTNHRLASLLELAGDGSPVSHWELLEALESLQRRSLIESNLVELKHQPVVIEYLTKQLIEQVHAETGMSKMLPVNGYDQAPTSINGYLQESQVELIHQLITDQLLSTSNHKNEVKG